ncbi:MAG: c(7)-type cytochrome triheme domain-containing protein [Nitrospirota bacterium]
MKYTAFILCFLVIFAGIAIASMPGKTVEYAGGEAGKVIFNGSTHGVQQGMKCPDCHPTLFQMKKGEYKMTKEGHGDTTKGCGVCHNGEKAFSQTNEADCAKCHQSATPAEAPAEAPAPKEAPAQ